MFLICSQLFIDLSVDSRMRDTLRELGITIGDWGVVDEGLIKLRKVLDVVIRYLENLDFLDSSYIYPAEQLNIDLLLVRPAWYSPSQEVHYTVTLHILDNASPL